MSKPQCYNLHNLFQIAHRRKRFIVLLSLGAIIICIATYFILPPKYKAETVFVLKNPLYGDRGNLYNNETTDYFAGETEIDRLISMSESDEVKATLIRNFRLDEAYKLDTAIPKEYDKLKKLLSKRLKLYRAESKNIVLLYTDKNPDRAANLANYTVNLLEQKFRWFYNDMRSQMYNSMSEKIAEQDSTLDVLTDTLIRLREQYGIYDIISPSRNNLMLSALKDNGKKDFAKGIEVIQNIESLKDEVVNSRAKNITLMNQYTTGATMHDLPLTSVIIEATPPVRRAGTPLVVLIILSAFAGLFFGLIYVFFENYLHEQKHKS